MKKRFVDLQKELISEKSKKGIEISRYLINPSLNETIKFAMNTTAFGSLRFIHYKNNLYAWNAMSIIHYQFLKSELMVEDYIKAAQDVYCGYMNFSLSHAEIGHEIMKRHGKLIDDLLKHMNLKRSDLRDDGHKFNHFG